MTHEDRYQKFWEQLSPAYPITQGAFKLPIATELFALPEQQHDTLLCELSAILHQLLEKYGTKESAAIRAAEAGEARIIPLLTEDFTGVVRFDCVIDETTKEFKVLEVNCDYPDGLILHDKTFSVLSDKPVTRHQDLLASLFTSSTEVTILYSPQANFVDGYHAEKIALEESFETPVEIRNSTDFTSTKTIRRCLEVSKLTESNCEELGKFPHTYINTFALRTLGYKNLLSDIDHSFVPKTIPVTEETTAHIIEHRVKFVLKPIEGCEGNGIYFGKDHTDTEWGALVEKVKFEYYIAQEFIVLSKRGVTFYEDGGIKEHQLYFDLCPYFFIKNGAIIGNGYTLMRFSEHPVVNVTKGGGIGYHTLSTTL